MIDLTKRMYGKTRAPVKDKVHWEYPKAFGGDVKLVITLGKKTQLDPGDTLTIQIDPRAILDPTHGRDDR
jgi:hypothetical protein